jgi:hypothetical protein
MRQAAAATLLFAAGCGTPAPPPAPPAVRLSTQNTAANVAPIAEFFRRTCLAAPADDEQMNAAIAESRWAVRQVNAQNWEGPSIWEFDHGTLQWFHNPSMNACILSLDSLVSPTPAALGAALRPFVRRPGFQDRSVQQDRIVWTWPADGTHRMVLTIELVPPSPGRTFGAGRQRVSLDLVRESTSATGQNRE